MKTLVSPLMMAALSGAVCAPLPAQVQVTVDGPATLREGGKARLHASKLGAWPQPAMRWGLVELDRGATLSEPDRDGWVTFTAPRIRKPQETFKVRVAPEGGNDPETLTSLLVRSFSNALDGGRLSLLAGDPKASGTDLGKGLAARFGHIVHMARLDGHPDPELAGRTALVDQTNHRILVMEADGTVRVWLGSPDGKPGHTEGAGTKARFRGPAALVVWPKGTGRLKDWRAVLLDPGNHLVSAVGPEGWVSPLAGSSGDFGDAPHRFRKPAGAVFDPNGALYVTDRDNCVIVKLDGDKASVLAGQNQAFGFQDGKGEFARFTAPGAIVLEPRSGHLLVGDGNRIRRVTPEGVVTTLIGSGERGFEEHLAKAPARAAADRMKGIPCLAGVGGLTVVEENLLIADLGNNALRRLDLNTGELITVAGDPERHEFSAGRLSNGRKLAAGTAATLASPQHVILDPASGMGLVAMHAHGKGSCVAALRVPWTEAEAKAETIEFKAETPAGDDAKDDSPSRIAPVENRPAAPAESAAAIITGGVTD